MDFSGETTKMYLMISGTLMPAFAGVILVSSIKREFKIDGLTLLMFAGLSCVGGYVTAKMIK